MKIAQPGFRVRVIVIATTLLDHVAYPLSELAELYRARWNAELDLRSLKTNYADGRIALQNSRIGPKGALDAHSGLQPHSRNPRSDGKQTQYPAAFIELQGCHADLEAFQPVIALQGENDAAHRLRLYHDLQDAIAQHRVADRPDRYEPRLKKRHANSFAYLGKPRAEIKRDMAKVLRSSKCHSFNTLNRND